MPSVAWEAAGNFMWSMAGNVPGCEEAPRALYAKDRVRLADCIREWSPDIHAHVERLVVEAVRLQRASESGAPSRVPG